MTPQPEAGSHGKKRPKRSASEFMPARLSLSALRAAAAALYRLRSLSQRDANGFWRRPNRCDDRVGGEQPAIRKTANAVRSSAQPVACSGARWPTPASRAKRYISRTPSSTLNFKWTPRGKRRLHQRPREGEIDACNPWLTAEIRVVKPQVLVCLGATAARAAFEHSVRLQDYRGKFTHTPLAPRTFVTVHPSAILRLQNPARADQYTQFVADLKRSVDKTP